MAKKTETCFNLTLLYNKFKLDEGTRAEIV